MEKITINIDSDFRDISIYPLCSKFMILLSDNIKNVISIKISSFELKYNDTISSNYNYLFLKINDYGNFYTICNNDNIYLYPYKILGKIILSGNNNSLLYDNYNFISNEYVFKYPININKFNIELLTPNGNIFDELTDNYSFTLELIYNRNNI